MCSKKLTFNDLYIQTFHLYENLFHVLYIELGPLLGVAQGEVLENSAELNCTLACFSPNIHCELSNIAINGVKCELTPNYTTSSILGLFNSYDYPTQKIMIYNLTSGTRYNYCVTGVSVSDEDMVEVGQPICGSFTTSTTRNANDGMHICYYMVVVYVLVCIHNY